MKIKVEILEQQFLLTYLDSRFDEIEGIIRQFPPTLLSHREFPYSITDKKINVKYQVNRVEGGIQMIFQKEQLAHYDIADLIDSLQDKLKAHLNFMTFFFRTNKQISWKAIKFIQYAPTDVVIGMQFGNMLDCEFYISKVIGHSLLQKEDKYLHISLIKGNILDGYPSSQFLKAPPLNLHVLVCLQDVWSFCAAFHSTYLPVQLIYQAQIDYSNMTNQSINNLYSFTPNLELGVFQFRHQQAVLSVQVASVVVNNKIQISLREASAYASMMGYHQNQRLDFTKYYEDFKMLIKSWEFERIFELQDFFQKFLIVSLGYAHFYECRTLLFQILRRIKYDKYFIKVFIIAYRYMTYFQSIMNQNPKREIFGEQKKLYLMAGHLSDRLHHIFSMTAYDDTSPQLMQILKAYQDKIDEQINRLKNQQLSFENEINMFMSKLSTVQFEQNSDLSFSIRIHIVQGGTYEYRFQKQSISKRYQNAEQTSWTLREFPKTEEICIVSYF